jgi:hypothetical protein
MISSSFLISSEYEVRLQQREEEEEREEKEEI